MKANVSTDKKTGHDLMWSIIETRDFLLKLSKH